MEQTFNLLADFISKIGFPVAVAVYMIYTNNRQTELHSQEQKEMTQAINELKVVIQALADKIMMSMGSDKKGAES